MLYWGLDKISTIFQTIFSIAFSCMKPYELWLIFHRTGDKPLPKPMRTKFINAYMRYMVSVCYHIGARQKGSPLWKGHSKIRFQSTFMCSMILLKSVTKFPADTKLGLVEVMAFCRTDNVDRNIWRHMASLEFMQSMPKRHTTPLLLRQVIRACFFGMLTSENFLFHFIIRPYFCLSRHTSTPNCLSLWLGGPFHQQTFILVSGSCHQKLAIATMLASSGN